MVPAKELSQTCQQFSAWNPPDLDHMSHLQLEQNSSFQCFPPTTFTANAAFSGKYTSDLLGLDTVQQAAVAGSLNLLPQCGNIPCSTRYPYVADSQLALPHRLGVTDKPLDVPAAPLKRFLIFDKSGNQTRLFCSPFSLEDRAIPAKIPATVNVYFDNLATQVDRQMLVKSTVEEKWDENDLADGEGEMREDSAEINALLYSDSDDEYDDTDGEDEEVTSTGHTPLSLGEGHVENKSLHEFSEEVAISDESPKRQRLLDGSYKKSSLVSFDSPMKQTSYGDDSESSCADARNYCDDIDSSKGEKKVRIRDALKILEQMMPGSKNKDPFSIIDDAIVYLKTMRAEAEALGLGSYSEPPESATFSQ